MRGEEGYKLDQVFFCVNQGLPGNLPGVEMHRGQINMKENIFRKKEKETWIDC